MRILLIEDDLATAQSIELMLKSENHAVHTTEFGEDGIDLAKRNDYDLILLDLNLPDMNGFDVLNAIQKAGVTTPVIIESGTRDPQARVRAFNDGAADYLTKPFEKAELLARCNAVVRRSIGGVPSAVTIGTLSIELDTKTVKVNGHRLHLTGKEYELLELFALRKGSTMTKQTILDHLYGGMDEPEMKIIDVFVCKLRKKIAAVNDGTHYIETIWGRGYVFSDPNEAQNKVSPAAE